MTEAANPTVFIALPAYGQVNCSATTSTLLGLSRELERLGLAGGFGTLSYPDITEIRNIFASIWYDRMQTSHMLFVDADMAFSPQLVLDMLAQNKPLVGALCPKKKLPIEFAGRAKQGDVQVINGFMEVSGIGGAVMLISREVVTAILQKYPELSDEVTPKNHAAREILEGQGCKRLLRVFDPVIVDGEKFSEDLSFCRRWTDCGGQIWANITHQVSHIGLYEYSGCYFDQVKDHIRPTEAAPAIDPIIPALLSQQTLEAAE